MDANGGTITWHLTANDADFQLTMKRVRSEAKKTGDDVDRDTRRGFGAAKLSLDDFRKSLSRSASLFRDFQIALRGFELTSMIIGVSVATGAVIELAGALSALAGLLYTVPAGVATFAGAFAGIKIATSGIADAFKDATKQTSGLSATQTLARRQADLLKSSMKQQEGITKRLNDLTSQYAETLEDLAKERMRILNEEILKGVTAWSNITRAASSFLDVAASLDKMAEDVAEAQMNLNSALITYGANSIQAREATQALYAAQAKLAAGNAELDGQYATIGESVKDLATNLESLRKANRNEMQASLLNLKAMKLEKQSRGENINDITDMIDVLEGLIDIKDTKLTVNPDLGGAQIELDALKSEFPNIAVAARQAASDTEESLVKSLMRITDQMGEVRKEREEMQQDFVDKMKDLQETASASAVDPFSGLSINAKKFVQALIEVRDAFQPVKEVIQDNFFAGLDVEIKRIASATFPLLQRGLGNIATAFNGMLLEAGKVITSPFFMGMVENSLNNTAKATEILTGAVEPLFVAFANLVNIGNPYVLMLSEWIVKQSELFAAFTSSEEGQKKVTEAINLGIDAMKQLGKFIGSVIGFFKDLFAISNESGVSIIGTLTEIIEKAREWMGTEEGQRRLTALFEAADTILRALFETLGQVINGILGVIEAYNNLDGPMKDIITNILVFSALITPLITYISSVAASLKLVGLVGKEIWQAGALGVSGLTKGFGFAKQAVFDLQSGFNDTRAAGSAFTGVMGTIGGKAREISDGFKLAVGSMKDMALTGASVAKQSVVNAATMAKQGAVAAAGWVTGAAKAASAWVVQFTLMIARAVATGVTMAANAVVASAAWVAGAVATAAAWVIANAAMLGVWGLIIAAVVGAVALIVANWDGIVNFFKGVWDAIVGFISGAIEWVKQNWPLLLAILLGPIAVAALLIAQNWEAIKGFFVQAWENIKGVWGNVVGFFKGVWDGIVRIFSVVVTFYVDIFRRAWDGIKNIWNNVGNFFRDVWNNIVGAFTGAMNLGKDIVTGLWNGISNMAGWIKDKIKGFGEGVLKGLKDFFGIKSPSRVMRDQVGEMLGLGIAQGITDSTAEAVRAAEAAAQAITDGFAMTAMNADLGINASGTLDSQFAPAMVSEADGTSGISNGVTINQTNEVYTDLDMDQVNRNLTWELNKI